DQPPVAGLVRVQALSADQELHPVLGGDPAAQQLGSAAAGQQFQGDLGQADDGLGHGDDRVRGEDQLQGPAEGGAVEGGHDRLGGADDAQHEVVDAGQELRGVGARRQFGKPGDVGSGSEGALLGGGEDQG